MIESSTKDGTMKALDSNIHLLEFSVLTDIKIISVRMYGFREDAIESSARPRLDEPVLLLYILRGQSYPFKSVLPSSHHRSDSVHTPAKKVAKAA
jgi:hypothetical protein